MRNRRFINPNSKYPDYVTVKFNESIIESARIYNNINFIDQLQYTRCNHSGIDIFVANLWSFATRTTIHHIFIKFT